MSHIYNQPITEAYLRHASVANLKKRHEYLIEKRKKIDSELTKVQHRIMIQAKLEMEKP